MSDAFPWLVAALVAAVLVAAVGLRAVIRRGPGFGIGTVLLTVGICVSDAARFWMHDPVGAVVLSAVASLGLGLFVHALFRSWLEILCEAWLLGAGAALSLHFALMLLGSPSQSLATNLDLVLLATSLFTSATLVRLRSELFPHRGFLAPAVMASLNARDLMWLLGFLGSALGVPALGTAALVAQGIGYLAIAGIAVANRREGWTPMYERSVYVGARTPYAVAVLVVVLALATRVVDPQVPRASVLAVGGTFVSALLTRQVVTGRRLREAMAESRQQEEYFRSLVQDSLDVIMICDGRGVLEYVSPVAERVIGTEEALRSVDDPRSSTLAEVLLVDPTVVTEALRLAKDEGSALFDVQTDGRVLETSVAPRPDGFVVAVRDVTERVELRERLHALAYNDTLTGLANRRQLLERLATLLDEAGRATPVAVIFIYLDRFKQVNDSSGHHAGDALLREVAARITSEIGPDRLLARLGGDEFAVVASAGLDEATALAERVHESLAQPYGLGDRVHQVGASIGVAAADPQEPGVGPEELLQRADLAMYAAKQSNEAWRAYDPGMRAAAERRADADHEITRAWGAESVRLYLQPIVRTHDLAVHSVEALLRWVGADGRVVGPATVLDYATRTGHMTRLTEWVLSGTVTSLRRLGPGGIPVSVNLPTALLDVDDVAPRLEEMLRRGGLRPTDVHLELAEDAMVDRGPRSTQTVQGLRAPADAERLQSLRELASWGSFMGAGGARHTVPSSFALGGAEC